MPAFFSVSSLLLDAADDTSDTSSVSPSSDAAEWIKVYGAVFGKSEEAEKLFDAKVKETKKNDNGVNDEKTDK